MPWARFEIMSGMIDSLLILIGVVLMIQFRILRRTLKRLQARVVLVEEENRSSHPGIVPNQLPSLAFDQSREALEQERKRLETLIRETEQLRSDLSILFYDVQRFLDDLTPVVRGTASENPEGAPASGMMYSLPEEGPLSSSSGSEPMKETVIRMSREGRSIPEIASAIGRGEGEVAFLLSMEKVGRS